MNKDDLIGLIVLGGTVVLILLAMLWFGKGT